MDVYFLDLWASLWWGGGGGVVWFPPEMKLVQQQGFNPLLESMSE